MPSRSEKTALAFYERLGPTGLAQRTRPGWDAEIASRLQEQLPPAARILDLGCGYGRIAIPLVRGGHRLVALDLCQALLRHGQREAREASQPVSWIRATMTALPLADRAFDVVLCLWTAFFELLDRREQVLALSEVLRVLRPGGFALFEGPVYREPTSAEIASGRRFGPGCRLFRFEVSGAQNWLYCHDASSLHDISRAAGIHRPSVYTAPWAGRERLFLRFENRADDGGFPGNGPEARSTG